MNETSPVRLKLLGQASAIKPDGAVLRFPTRHATLALAVLSWREQRREELAMILWPYATPQSRAKRIRSLLPHLRRALGPHFCEVDDRIFIADCSITADAWNLAGHEDYAGDFMPGFDQDWVIDRRLELREAACQSAIDAAQQAWKSGDGQLALQLVARAAEIDPLHEAACQLRVSWLEQLGQRSHSIHIADEYRRRTFHDLGTLPPAVVTEEQEQTHPLVQAANWLLDTSPHDAGAMLIATQNEWWSLPVQQALDVHERVLNWMGNQERSARKILEAQRISLMVQAGQLHQNIPAAEVALCEADAAGEAKVAAQLALALSYACLSNGDFAQAIKYAKKSVAAVEKTDDPVTTWTCKYNFAIIQGHSGEHDASSAKTLEFADKHEEAPSELLRAGILISSIETRLQAGQLDQACRQLELGRRLFGSLGPHRHEAWILLSEAQVYSAIGDHSEAQASLQTASKIGWRVAGHSAMAMAADQLARTWCKLGQYDLAVESANRALRLRRHFQTVPSLWERPVIQETHLALRENLGDSQTRRALGAQ